MKNVIVSGASGFIASHLIEALCIKGYNVYGLTRSVTSKLETLKLYQNFHIMLVDMNDYKNLSRIIPVNCDICYSIAWEGIRDSKGKSECIQNQNIERVYALCREVTNLGCKRFVQVGSLAEYGYYTQKINESMLCKPMTVYGRAKYNCFMKLDKYCKENNIEFIEARLGSIYGFEDKGVISDIIVKFIKGQNSEFTSCNQLWEFMFIDDCIDLLLKIIGYPYFGNIYNISNGETLPLKDFFIITKNLVNRDISIEFGEISNENYASMNIMCDITRLSKELNYTPIPFIEGVKGVINKYRSSLGCKEVLL